MIVGQGAHLETTRDISVAAPGIVRVGDLDAPLGVVIAGVRGRILGVVGILAVVGATGP